MKKKTPTVARKSKGKASKPTGRAAKKPRQAAQVAEDVHKFEASRPPKARRTAAKKTSADIDQLGDLPRSYGQEHIFAVAQEPHWLFCYWDYNLTTGIEEEVFLRLRRSAAKQPEAEVSIPAETNSWYLSVREADADYHVEIGYYRGGRWKNLARSGNVLTPRDTVAGFGEAIFANMSFHATFQQMVVRLRGEIREGESLAEALGRLQKRDDLPLGGLSPAQRMVLDRILETELGSLTSSQLASYLGSPGANLFSGGFAPSSWSQAAASWTQAPGGFSSGFLAAFGLAGASWTGASWGQTPGGSWSSATLSSWSPLTSVMSSWQTPRDFFMHVNAEVIFYGGTHPDAKVSVDGKDIMVRPDGTFRYHFVLPDGEFEIPIVATSPDGRESRRAVLRFERATAREGDVGSTAQPPLGAPMGAKAT